MRRGAMPSLKELVGLSDLLSQPPAHSKRESKRPSSLLLQKPEEQEQKPVSKRKAVSQGLEENESHLACAANGKGRSLAACTEEGAAVVKRRAGAAQDKKSQVSPCTEIGAEDAFGRSQSRRLASHKPRNGAMRGGGSLGGDDRDDGDEKEKEKERVERRHKYESRRASEDQVMQGLGPVQQLLMLGVLPPEADINVWSEFGTLANRKVCMHTRSHFPSITRNSLFFAQNLWCRLECER